MRCTHKAVSRHLMRVALCLCACGSIAWASRRALALWDALDGVRLCGGCCVLAQLRFGEACVAGLEDARALGVLAGDCAIEAEGIPAFAACGECGARSSQFVHASGRRLLVLLNSRSRGVGFFRFCKEASRLCNVCRALSRASFAKCYTITLPH